MVRLICFWVLGTLLILWSIYMVGSVAAFYFFNEPWAALWWAEPLVRGTDTNPATLAEEAGLTPAFYGLVLWSGPALALAACALLVRPRFDPAVEEEREVKKYTPPDRQEPQF
jgi:hypothetical protein